MAYLMWCILKEIEICLYEMWYLPKLFCGIYKNAQKQFKNACTHMGDNILVPKFPGLIFTSAIDKALLN